MAGHDGPEPKITGIWKYYNSETIQGRAGATKITYGVLALFGLYMYLKPKKVKDTPK